MTSTTTTCVTRSDTPTTLTDEDFRSRGRGSGRNALRIPYEQLDSMLTAAQAFIAAYFHVEFVARQIWGCKKRQAVPYDPHYKALMEILVDIRDLMCGFRVHWPNGSQSTYRRDNGIEMTNCLVSLEPAATELVVGRHAKSPLNLAPLLHEMPTRFTQASTAVT